MAAAHRQLRSGRVTFGLIRFCTWILHQPPLRPWTWLYHKKGNLTQNSRYTVRTEILSTFHIRVECISQHHVAYWNSGYADAEECQKPCQKQPLPLEARGLPSNTWMPGPTPLTVPNDSSIDICTFTQWRNKVPIGYNGTPQIHPPNCPFPFDGHHQNLIHPYRARPHSPPQTASGSNQLFCHNSHVQTGRWGRRTFSTKSALLHRERRANNVYKML